MFDATTGEHIYISTACLHDLHGRCRRVCKFCPEGCLCLCHTRPKETAVSNPENLDNPATPDVDVDPSPQPEVPEQQSQPVVEPDPVTTASGELGQNAGAVTYTEERHGNDEPVRVAVANVEEAGHAGDDPAAEQGGHEDIDPQDDVAAGDDQPGAEPPIEPGAEG